MEECGVDPVEGLRSEAVTPGAVAILSQPSLGNGVVFGIKLDAEIAAAKCPRGKPDSCVISRQIRSNLGGNELLRLLLTFFRKRTFMEEIAQNDETRAIFLSKPSFRMGANRNRILNGR